MTSIALSQERLNAIAEEIAARLLEQHYFEQGIVTGEQLKTFTQHPQINKFLLFQVYQVWSMQVSRLRHPYFDFDHAHIQQTLTHLQNLLSQHIAIKAEDFRPLLIQAVFNTLRLTLQPAEAFSDFFFTGGDKLPLGTFAKYVPFFSDFDFAVGSILSYCQKNGIETVDKDIFKAKFDKVINLYNARQEGGIDGYRSKSLASLTHHTLESLAHEATQEAISRSEAERQSQMAMQEEVERQRRADEDARRQEEAQRQAEADREAADRAAAEAEAQRAQQSFFDTLEAPVQATFELTDEPETAPAEPETPAYSPEPQAISVTWDSSIKVVDDDDDDNQWEIVSDEPAADTPVATDTPPADNSSAAFSPLDGPSPLDSMEHYQPFIYTPVQGDTMQPIIQPETQTRSLDAAPEVQTRSLFGGLDSLQEAPAPVADTLTFADDTPSEPEQPQANINPLDSGSPTQEAEFVPVDDHTAVAQDPPGNTVAHETEAPKPLTLAERLQQQVQNNTATPPPPATPAETQIRLEAIPIHKQYQFVKKVFGGNNVRFRIIVDKINAATSAAEIEETLEKFVFTAPEVDKTDAVVEEFVALMRSRFS